MVQGAEDNINNIEKFVQPIADATPSCRIEVLKGVDHFPLTEAADEFNSLIVRFIESL